MTATWLALPPHALAFAVATRGEDPDLRPGTHFRLLPGDGLGWPLAPLGVWRVNAVRQDDPAPWWTDSRGRHVDQASAEFNLDAHGGELRATLWRRSPVDHGTRIGVELLLPRGARGALELREGAAQRLVARRSEMRLLIGSPQPKTVRVFGQGVPRLRTWWLDESPTWGLLIEQPSLQALSLPLDPGLPWYVGGLGRGAAQRRVADGAPMRWTPPDRPDGPFDALTDGDEVRRVDDFAGRLEELAYLAARDPDTHPVLQAERRRQAAGIDADGRRQPWTEVEGNVWGELQFSMIDPGAARYLGFMGWLPEVPDEPDPVGHPSADVLLIGGVFACPPDSPLAAQAPDAAEARLLAAWMHREPELGPLVRALRERGHVVRVQLAPALVAPLPDRPEPPRLAAGPAHWLLPPAAAPGGGPAGVAQVAGSALQYQRAILLDDLPLAGPTAVAWHEGGEWRTRHRIAGPSGRVAVRVAGQRSAWHALRLLGARQGVLEEAPLPEVGDDGAPWRCRVALADLFGRFGAPAELSLPLPERPPVPQPGLSVEVQGLPEDAPVPAAGPLSPGQLAWQVPVPGLPALAGGALPIVAVHLGVAPVDGPGLAVLGADAVGGWRVDVAPAAQATGTTLHGPWPLPALQPGDRARVMLSAHFEDAAGRTGPSHTVAVDFVDGRAPVVPPSGVGLMWTPQPGPGAEVEVHLRLPGRVGERWRAYLAGDRALDPAPWPDPGAADPPRRPRAMVAAERTAAAWKPSAERDRYRLLGDEPLVVGADGFADLRFSLPRTLESVQFLCLVPVSVNGAEAGFDLAARVALAVPSDRRPPPPRLDGRVDVATGRVRLSATSEGLDRVMLEAAEPGLFTDPPAADARAPTLRWRRAVGALTRPDLARVVGEVPLRPDGEHFVAEFEDQHDLPDGLPSYMPVHYWAELRLPAERRLPAGWLQQPWPADGVQPSHGRQLIDHPGAWSAPSAPTTVMHLPTDPPGLLLDECSAQVVPEAGPWRVTASLRGPALPQRAPGRFSVAVALEWPDGERGPLGGELALGRDGRTTWTGLAPPAPQPPVALWLVLSDPVGRAAAAQRLPITA